MGLTNNEGRDLLFIHSLCWCCVFVLFLGFCLFFALAGESSCKKKKKKPLQILVSKVNEICDGRKL